MSTADDTPIRVFISYSHDSQAHKDRILALARRLRESGIDCIVDQAELPPDEGWPRWMMSQVKTADFVLICCTETYERRFRGDEQSGRGPGATWEANLIINESYEQGPHSHKFIPIMFEESDKAFIPAPLRGRDYFDISREERFGALYRLLTNQPEVVLPPMGKIIPMPPRQIPAYSIVQNEAKGAREAESVTGTSHGSEDPSSARLLLFGSVKRLLMANHQVGQVLTCL